MNKTIWMCWFQGWDDAPCLVKNCHASWVQKNSEWNVVLLDEQNISDYVSIPLQLQRKKMSKASYSDIVRTYLLVEHGGVWADATLYCRKPLDEWLPKVSGNGFFLYQRPGNDRIIASWFIASTQNHAILQMVLEEITRYWTDREDAHDYFWYHSLYQKLFDNDGVFMKEFLKTHYISADGPHSVQMAGMLNRKRSEYREIVDWESAVYKLTYRYNKKKLRGNALINHLWDIDGLPRCMRSNGLIPRIKSFFKSTTTN